MVYRHRDGQWVTNAQAAGMHHIKLLHRTHAHMSGPSASAVPSYFFKLLMVTSAGWFEQDLNAYK